MTIIYSVIISIYIALGASCTGDVSRLQKVMEGDMVPGLLEPGSMFFIYIVNLINNNISTTLLHFAAVLTLLLSLRYFFLKTKLITSFDFYIISFLGLFNPISFELISNNTRQLLFISIFSIPFYRLIYSKFREVYQFDGKNFLKKKNYNRFFIYFCLLISLITHSSSPMVFAFLLFYLIIYLFYKVIFENKFQSYGLKIKSKFNIKYFLFSLLFIIFFFLIRNRIEYVVNLYTPKGLELVLMVKESYFGFSYDSPGILLSLLFTAFLIIYTFIKLPAKLIFFKILNLTLFVYISLILYMGLTIPFLSSFLRRAYQPILLVVFPVTLILLFSILQTKYKNFISVLFLLLCLGWQSLKLGSANYSLDTFYSLNNTHISACAPLRIQEK